MFIPFPNDYILLSCLVLFSKMSAQEEGIRHPTYFVSVE